MDKKVFALRGDVLEEKYHGAGLALAAVRGGEVVDLVYLEDTEDPEDLVQALMGFGDPAFDAAIGRLAQRGTVLVGMLGSCEFTRL